MGCVARRGIILCVSGPQMFEDMMEIDGQKMLQGLHGEAWMRGVDRRWMLLCPSELRMI